MTIPAHFEFHYVQNGVKRSVTVLAAFLFKTNPSLIAARGNEKKRSISEDLTDR